MYFSFKKYEGTVKTFKGWNGPGNLAAGTEELLGKHILVSNISCLKSLFGYFCGVLSLVEVMEQT